MSVDQADLVLTEAEARLLLDFRNANEQARDHVARLLGRLATKFPERQRPALKLVRATDCTR